MSPCAASAINVQLVTTLTDTNCIESMISVDRTTMCNVKSWQAAATTILPVRRKRDAWPPRQGFSPTDESELGPSST